MLEIKPDQTISMKLNTGEEVIGRVLEITDKEFIIKRPMMLIRTEKGIGLGPFMFSTPQHQEFRIHRNSIMAYSPTEVEMAKKYTEANEILSNLIIFLEKNLEDDDKTGIGTLAAAYANRGIIKDRNKNYEEALKDYVKALGIDHEAVAGPGLGTIILNYKFKSSSVKERALYLNEQLQLPEDERVLSIEELDAGQVMHKPGKL